MLFLIHNLLKNQHNNYKKLKLKYKNKIHFFDFESLSTDTNIELKKICKILKTQPTKYTKKILIRENCNRKKISILRKKFLSKKIEKKLSPFFLNLFKDSKNYNS